MDRKKKNSKTPLFGRSGDKRPDLNLFGSKVVFNIVKSPKKNLNQSNQKIKESEYSDMQHEKYFSSISKYKKRNILLNSQIFRSHRFYSGHNVISATPKTQNSLEITPKSNKSSRSSFATKSRLRIFKEKIESLINI